LTAVALIAAGCAAELGDTKPIPGSDEPFPNLASVPPRREPYTTPAERRELEERLTLDRAAARPAAEGRAVATAAPAVDMINEAGLPAEAVAAARVTDGAWLNPNARKAGAHDLMALLFFANGSAALSGKAKDVLRGVAAVQRERGGVVRLIGHASGPTRTTDMGEAARINRAMSFARAEAAAKQLRRFGLSGDQIEVQAAGAAAPAFDERTTPGEAGNRRVEVYLQF
jgi:outer membrane protein OmpA-like peptidoglycan-associated protein